MGLSYKHLALIVFFYVFTLVTNLISVHLANKYNNTVGILFQTTSIATGLFILIIILDFNRRGIEHKGETK